MEQQVPLPLPQAPAPQRPQSPQGQSASHTGTGGNAAACSDQEPRRTSASVHFLLQATRRRRQQQQEQQQQEQQQGNDHQDPTLLHFPRLDPSILENRRRIFAHGGRYNDQDDKRSVDTILNAAIAASGAAGVGTTTTTTFPPTVMQGNGAAAAGTAMAVGPTPAGHQNELNLIYGMVEELSRQLADNRRATEDIVSGLGRLRNRARDRGLSNNDILDEAADEIFGMPSPSALSLATWKLANRFPIAQEPNLEALLSILTESLDRAKVSRDANFSLLTNYARVLATILTQFHLYKQRHITEVSAWHRSYRGQLAEARAENERLREQIWDMQEHASHANAMLREFRRRFDGEVDEEEEGEQDEAAGGKAQKSDSDEAAAKDGQSNEQSENKKQKQKQIKQPRPYWTRCIDDRARRQELRFWKRMAMPHIPDDDPIWSDDDDLIDSAEKERLSEMERKVAEQQALAGFGNSGSGDEHEHELEHGGGEDSDGEGSVINHHQPPIITAPVAVALGGVPMERDTSSGSGSGGRGEMMMMPAPPPRPASTGSTGGFTG
ncbi:hypothetical protein SLS62_003123 [Diatrype stigma]|uniref:Uncharacterized protein n=1 Tax=Diatrype stigma TaxID=117547 RepID=A0AAN9USV8_9PEZI